MAEQNSGNNNFNQEELPIPIPPADQAWQSMRQKLDVELPVKGNLPAPAPAHVRYVWIKGVFVVAAVATAGILLWQYNRKQDARLAAADNNIHDTSLAYIQPVSPASDSQTLIPSEQNDTASQHVTSPAINGAAAIVNGVPVSASSEAVQDSQSSETWPALQSSPSQQRSGSSSVPLQPSFMADSLHRTAKKTITQQTAEHLVTGKQPLKPLTADDHPPIDKKPRAKQHTADQRPLKQPTAGKYPLIEQQATAKQQATNKQLPKPFASGRNRSGRARLIPVSEPPATQDKQLSSSAYPDTDGHSVGKTERHPSLQLSFIHAPVSGYNNSLQHAATPLVPRQPGGKYAEKRWALYIQLNIALPYDSTYLLGPNGKNQFYRYLIPGVRLERKLWKGALSLDVQPAVSLTPTSNTYKVDIDPQGTPYDTVRSLIKQFGWGMALQYQMSIHPKWQLGTGIQASFLQKALMRQTLTDSMGITKTSVFTASVTDKQELSRVHINGVAEVDYMAGKWQFGLRALIPVTKVSKMKEISARPVNVEVVVRRRLWKLR